MADLVFDPLLTKPDELLLKNLRDDILKATAAKAAPAPSLATAFNATNLHASHDSDPVKRRGHNSQASHSNDHELITYLTALNTPTDPLFEPTVFSNVTYDELKRLPAWLNHWLLQPYLRLARAVVRVEADTVMLTHLLLYATTTIPSALVMFLWRANTWHGFLHALMQLLYAGPYTLLMHQHIHGGGVLHPRLAAVDAIFPYITNLFMGHTHNSYYYHHVKHHHVEGNGPNDLSSTLRYQRDSPAHFAAYVARFILLIWFELPLYFARRGRWTVAAKTAFWELGSYATYVAMYRVNAKATCFVFLWPLVLMRIAMMVGNWGQHALVNHDEPNSDFRSSITLIDVPSNRHCFNDGYHTSHHLNPLRHWREHPVAFLKAKATYAAQQALVFHNIDYMMLTVRLLMKDYTTLARCMVPIGDQISMSMDERVALLKSHTQRFTEEELIAKFKKT
ncbi:Fatty acid desaturase [Ceratocystis platani]|uniref:Fatty acid desaturase n=1 Tax=Ceratocystis fimbriata f. sp. platani TaxID=88771 RepID=A0A0F8B1B8_CERFI|nr:Fatty acid desaturase [Ceratocystis platani]